jgi:hypothetical protein
MKEYSAEEIKQQFDDYFKDQFNINCLYSSKLEDKSLLHRLKNAQTIILANVELLEVDPTRKALSLEEYEKILNKIKNALRHIGESA